MKKVLSAADNIKYSIAELTKFNTKIELSDIYLTPLYVSRKLLVDFNTGKTQLVSFDQSNNTGAIDVKMDSSVLEEKSSFKMLQLTFFSKLDLGLFLKLLCISISLLYGHASNTIVMSGLVLLAVTWNCWVSYKNGHAGPLVFHLLPLSNPWLIVKM